MRFDPVPDELAVALAREAGPLGPFARLRYCAVVESTNDVALALASAGEPEGTSVLAEQQTRGRGRRGRDWHSPPETGLYLSVVVRPPEASRAMAVVTLGAGVAVATAVRTISGLPVELKWPNDVVIGRPWRKLGGILCETATAGGRVEAIVIGIGLNHRHVHFPPPLASRASTIETELGRSIDRPPLVVAILREVRSVMSLLHDERIDAVRDAWRRFGRAGLAGQAVRWTGEDGERHGRARDIDADGALLVETNRGVERVIAGEVVWETLSDDVRG